MQGNVSWPCIGFRILWNMQLIALWSLWLSFSFGGGLRFMVDKVFSIGGGWCEINVLL